MIPERKNLLLETWVGAHEDPELDEEARHLRPVLDGRVPDRELHREPCQNSQTQGMAPHFGQPLA